ncbi:MAG: hypothetical protein EP343_12085 [Deltaproteobacteria bacterium]|nr:MAG: hypothetical protein EP343_12085 [Deltaproteobacteria bacterium]
MLLTLSLSGQALSANAASGMAALGFGIALGKIALDPLRQSMYLVGYTRGVDVHFGKITAQSKSRGFYQDSDILIAKLSTSSNVYEWALCEGGAFPDFRATGDVSSDVAYDAVVDKEGYLYVSGIYMEPSVLGGFSLRGNGSFLAKLNPQGKFLWVKTFPSTLFTKNLGIDQQQQIFQASLFQRSFQIGSFSEQGPSDIAAVVQWSPEGRIVGVKAIRCMTKECELGAPHIRVHSSGEVTILGHLQGKAQFGNNIVESKTPTLYVARLDQKGTFAWVHTFDVNARLGVSSFTATKDFVYVAVVSLTVSKEVLKQCSMDKLPDGHDWLLFKWNTKGKCVWVRSAKSVYNPVQIALSEDEQHLYIAGAFKDSINLGSQTFVTQDSKHESFLWKISTAP